MASDEYSKALDKALSDLQQRVQQRDLLNADIAGLRETVRVLSTLVQMPSEKQREVAKVLAMADYATPSLTDAIRSLLLRESPKEMTAIEVRNALEESSNTEDCSLSACHAALKRMLSDREIEPGAPKNGKASYRRVIRLIARPNDNLSILHGILGSLAKPDMIDPDKLREPVRSAVSPESRLAKQLDAERARLGHPNPTNTQRRRRRDILPPAPNMKEQK